MLNYETYSKNNSLYNTPPSFSIYVTKLVLEWLKEQGGVSAIEEQNRMKSSLLYNFLDESTLFTSPVDPTYRSLMNIPFTTPSEELNNEFYKSERTWPCYAKRTSLSRWYARKYLQCDASTRRTAISKLHEGI